MFSIHAEDVTYSISWLRVAARTRHQTRNAATGHLGDETEQPPTQPEMLQPRSSTVSICRVLFGRPELVSLSLSSFSSHALTPMPGWYSPQGLLGRPVPLVSRRRVFVNLRYLSGPSRTSSPGASSTIPAPPSPEFLPLPRHIAPRRALLLLSVPVSPIHWPSHLDLASPLLSRASKTLKQHAVAVNAIYNGDSSLTHFPDKEVYPTRLFWPDGTHISYPAFDRDFLASEQLRLDLEYQVDQSRAIRAEGMEERYEVLVCTHGSRDCRCSDRGGPLVSALREDIERRGMGHRVKVSEIAHVGGHK
jgi:hypothetical protein